MTKSRVYLAKSNRANPNIVSNVRITLNNFDVDVIEYSGGQYSNNALLSCDYLVVVPESTPNLTDLSSEISIGKGLYEQIESFIENNDNKNVFIILDENFEVGGVFHLNIINYDNFINYGEIVLSSYRLGKLCDVLYDTFGETNNSPLTNLNNGEYLLLLTTV